MATADIHRRQGTRNTRATRLLLLVGAIHLTTNREDLRATLQTLNHLLPREAILHLQREPATHLPLREATLRLHPTEGMGHRPQVSLVVTHLPSMGLTHPRVATLTGSILPGPRVLQGQWVRLREDTLATIRVEGVITLPRKEGLLCPKGGLREDPLPLEDLRLREDRSRHHLLQQARDLHQLHSNCSNLLKAFSNDKQKLAFDSFFKSR